MPHHSFLLLILDQEVMPLGKGCLAGGLQRALESVPDDAAAVVA